MDNFINQNRDRCILLTVSNIVIYPGTVLWYKYSNRDFDVYCWQETNPKRERFFEKKYNHLIWVVPQNFLIKNLKIKKEKYMEIIRKFLDKYN